MSLESRIMNLPASGEPAGGSMAYKLGHRDARHAAAEIASEGDALTEQMAASLQIMVETNLGTSWTWPDSARATWLLNARALIAKASA